MLMKRIAHPALMLAVALLVSNSAESGARALASDRQAVPEERALLDRAPPTSADVVHELSGEYAGCTAFHAIEPQSGASQVVVEGDGELCQNLDRHHARYGTAISDPTDAPHSSPGELYGCLSCHAIDTSSGENRFLIERECRACHRPDRHHLLYGSAVRQPTAAPYSTSFDWYDCLSCHEIEAVSGSTHFLIERDCGACHDTRRVESVFVDIKPGSDLNRIQAEPRAPRRYSGLEVL
jgi:hypothetical protein